MAICILTSIILRLAMITCCHGFDFTMDRREYLIKNQTYCGLLQCQVDTVSDKSMDRLIKMDIFYLTNEQLLATMLAENSEIQSNTGNNTIVLGSMSKDHGEFHVHFSDVSNCSQTAFICKIQFKNSTNGKEIAEKFTLPINADQAKSDINVKTQISIGHKIFDKPYTIINKLASHTSLMNEETGISFELGIAGVMNSDEILLQRNDRQKFLCENVVHNFEQKLFEFEVKVRTQLEIFMIQMSSKIEDLKFVTKEINSNINEVKEQEVIRIKMQTISDLAQSNNESKLIILEKRMDDIIDNVYQLNDSLNLHKLTTHKVGLEIIQKLDFLLNENKLIGLTISHLENTATEILKVDRQINDTIKEFQDDVNNITKLLEEGEMMGEIQQSLTSLNIKLSDSKFLNEEVTMGEVVRGMQNMKLTLNDLKQSVNDKCNGDVISNKTDQRLSSLVEHLEDMKINQGSLETLLVNVTGSLNKCKTSGNNLLQLKCERGITGLLGSRVITSLENKKQVLCDTETDGGGWIIIQRRVNGQVNFTRNWDDYKNGFGTLDGDFWMGNELISNITSKEIYTLRIDIRQGSNAYRAEHDSFMVKNESDKYRLHLGVFSGNIRDSFREYNNMAFSTPDRDNDNWGDNCAQSYKSGWWYTACHSSNVNGVWGLNTPSGLCWYDGSSWKYLDFVEMKIRLK